MADHPKNERSSKKDEIYNQDEVEESRILNEGNEGDLFLHFLGRFASATVTGIPLLSQFFTRMTKGLKSEEENTGKSEELTRKDSKKYQYESEVFPLQRLFVENRLRDFFRTSTVSIPPIKDLKRPLPRETALQQTAFSNGKIVLTILKTFGEFPQYDIHLHENTKGLPLLSVRKSELPNLWEVENGNMFRHESTGESIAKIHEFPSNTFESFPLFAFVGNKKIIPNVPRLEMEPVVYPQGTSCYGRYEFRVTGYPQSIGGVNVMRHFHEMILYQCTSEEACLCLCILIAAELETKTKLQDIQITL